MIQKISSDEYLKRYDNMSPEEQRELADRVGQWMRSDARILARLAGDPAAQFENILQVSISWNDAQCQSFQEGARLLTAFVGMADTWLPDMLYTKSAKRAVKRLVGCLGSVAADALPENTKPLSPAGSGKNAGREKAKEEPAAGTVKTTQTFAPFRGPSSDGHIADGNNNGKEKPSEVKGTPTRPKHIDQYAYLLPAKTQERAATVRGLLRDLDVARENARRLMEAGEHGDKIAQWAKTATKLDEKLKNIYKELDSEWDKLVKSGRVSVDAFGNAVVNETAENPSENAADSNKAELSKEDKKRVDSLRSWLRDTRGPKEPGEKHDAYVIRWKEKYQEMVRLGGQNTVTDAVQKAAKLYGIDISKIKI